MFEFCAGPAPRASAPSSEVSFKLFSQWWVRTALDGHIETPANTHGDGVGHHAEEEAAATIAAGTAAEVVKAPSKDLIQEVGLWGWLGIPRCCKLCCLSECHGTVLGVCA